MPKTMPKTLNCPKNNPKHIKFESNTRGDSGRYLVPTLAERYRYLYKQDCSGTAQTNPLPRDFKKSLKLFIDMTAELDPEMSGQEGSPYGHLLQVTFLGSDHHCRTPGPVEELPGERFRVPEHSGPGTQDQDITPSYTIIPGLRRARLHPQPSRAGRPGASSAQCSRFCSTNRIVIKYLILRNC